MIFYCRAKVTFPDSWRRGRPEFISHLLRAALPFQSKQREYQMLLKELASRLIGMAEYADALCRAFPRHQCAATPRDFATHVGEAVKALTETTRQHISRS